jgi:NO-binding membrane sensor protein with MHYT domain
VPVNNFTYGVITPVLSYTLSVLGSLLALICTSRARRMADGGQRARWLLLAAWALGGTGIWVMHFMAMLGFGVDGETIRFDLGLTAASLLIAILVVAMGLMIVGFGRPNAVKIIFAGILTGFGVAGMHYTGMAAMRMPSHVSYDRNIVILSVVIAVVAATVALWFTVTLDKPVALGIAALIMGVAVNGMHFTAMYALRVSAFAVTPVAGITAFTFLGPIVVFVVAAIAVLLFALLSRTGLDGGEGERTTVLVPPTPTPTPAPGVGLTPGPGFGLGSNPVPGQGHGPDRRPGQGTSAAAFGHRR